MGRLLKSALICVALLSVGLTPVAEAQATGSAKARPVVQKSKSALPTAKKSSAASANKITGKKVAAKKANSKKLAKKTPRPVASDRLAETGVLAVQSGAALVVDALRRQGAVAIASPL